MGVTGVETEWGEVQGIPIREQGLSDKLALMRTASLRIHHTGGSDPNLRPGQSLTHAAGEETNWRSPRQGPRSRVCNRALATEKAWTSLLGMIEGRACNLIFHLRIPPFPTRVLELCRVYKDGRDHG